MDIFERVIKDYLDKRAAEDELFAVTFAKEGKSIKECCNFIKSQAKKLADKGSACLPREEVYLLAVHYYDEDDIKDIADVRCKIVTPYSVELTDEEKAELKKKAEDEYVDGLLKEMKRPKKKEQPKSEVEQLDLFA